MTRIHLSESDSEGTCRVGEAVKRGAVIVYPTDTVYGIGGNPFDEKVVQRILRIKKRERKPMPVLVSSVEGAKALIEAGPVASALMKLWPGALTIVSKKRRGVPDSLTFGGGTVGVRMPDHKLALRIIEAAGGAMIGTSANVSGRPAARSVEELDAEVAEAVDMVVDAGAAPGGMPSTVVEVKEGAKGESWKVVRAGSVSVEVIKAATGKKVGSRSRSR